MAPAPGSAADLAQFKFAAREELCVIMSAARAGMQQFPMTDPAWRLFEDIWKASNKLALMADPPPNRPGSTRA